MYFVRYIGSKYNLLKEIELFIDENINDTSNTFFDVFSGTGCVGEYFKKKYKITANDQLYFCYILSSAVLKNNTELKFSGLKNIGIKDPLNFLNNSIPSIDKSYFITLNYSPYGNCERMYLSIENASKIDFIRQKIQFWLDENIIIKEEFEYLLCCLINAIPYVSNISGTYGAYLKTWDKRSLKPIELIDVILVNNSKKNEVFNTDSSELVAKVSTDIAYIDPPYNGRQYTSNYHLLETIAKYDNPNIVGVTGIRSDSKQNSSKFCRKKTVEESLENLIKNIESRHIILSYSSEGLVSKQFIEDILKKYGIQSSYRLKEIAYRKYKSKILTKNDNLKEYLFYIQKDIQIIEPRNQVNQHTQKYVSNASNLVASPMNYIGGKFKLLSQILPFFPKEIENFYDVFSGGANVAVNVNAKNIFLNDINNYVIDILELFYRKDINDILRLINFYIKKYDLSKTNEDGFKKMRVDYNQQKSPLMLYTLVCYSFNYQFRFNNNHEYNNPFGKNKSHFSSKLEAKLINFLLKMKEKEINFSSIDFDLFMQNIILSKNTFVYCDPPYLITTGSYNDGNRGFKDWKIEEEIQLYNRLDYLNDKNIKFALSNVISHKGFNNDLLIEWSKKYNVHSLNHDYSQSSYNTSRLKSKEVLITNY